MVLEGNTKKMTTLELTPRQIELTIRTFEGILALGKLMIISDPELAKAARPEEEKEVNELLQYLKKVKEGYA
jgi:hypothetical protein